MQLTRFAIPDVIAFTPDMFFDERGYFYVSFNQRAFEDEISVATLFVQENHSWSRYGVLRGLHYQLAPKTQGKLVRVVRGEIFDVAVDIRKSSPTFGKWVGTQLSAENKMQLWIPEGFAHGFITLSKSAEVLYRTTDYYSPTDERCIIWSDSTLAIRWPVNNKRITMSVKDAKGVALQKAEVFD